LEKTEIGHGTSDGSYEDGLSHAPHLPHPILAPNPLEDGEGGIDRI
jgi:hypothetical protein